MSGTLFDDVATGRPASFTFAPATPTSTFTGWDYFGYQLGYTPGQVWVWVNGAKIPPTDFTATDGLTITLLTVSATAGDIVDVMTIQTIKSPDSVSFLLAQNLTSLQQKQARANAGVNDNNVLINPDFRINQRVYVSGTAAAAGAYGHDRWKAGAGGCTYTFTQLASSTQITITAGTAIQVVEDKNVVGGTYTLSWSGTATARYGVNTATPSGSYVSSPIVITGQTAGTTMSVEFSTGTLSTVKLETGAVATPFVMPDYNAEFYKCLRYFERFGAGTLIGVGHCVGSSYYIMVSYVPKRAVPSLTITNYASFSVYNTSGGGAAWSGWTGPFNVTAKSLLIAPSVSGTAGVGGEAYESVGTGLLDLSSEL